MKRDPLDIVYSEFIAIREDNSSVEGAVRMRVKIDPLDKLASKCVKSRDKWCQRCGGTGGLQTAHFHSRRKRSVRYDLENLCLLCFGCHQYFHENPDKFKEFFKTRLGERAFDMLNSRARITQKIDKAAIGLYLKARILEIDKEE